jgi:hypothetical protein
MRADDAEARIRAGWQGPPGTTCEQVDHAARLQTWAAAVALALAAAVAVVAIAAG